MFNPNSDTTSCTKIVLNKDQLILLADLYPFPSPYTRLSSAQAVSLGKQYNESQNRFRVLDNLDTTANRLLDLAIVEAKRSLSSTNEQIHPIYFSASALEYGYTLDTVTQLVPRLQDKSHALILLVQADQYGIAHSPFASATSIIGGRHK